MAAGMEARRHLQARLASLPGPRPACLRVPVAPFLEALPGAFKDSFGGCRKGKVPSKVPLRGFLEGSFIGFL